MSQADTLTATPRFRRGPLPLDKAYKSVSVKGVIAAWETWMDFVAERPWMTQDGIAPEMAEHMGVHPNTAARYRKVYHYLDLIEDHPGQYNPDGPNLPASVDFWVTDRNAAREALAGVERVYVSPAYRRDLPDVIVRHFLGGSRVIAYGDIGRDTSVLESEAKESVESEEEFVSFSCVEKKEDRRAHTNMRQTRLMNLTDPTATVSVFQSGEGTANHAEGVTLEPPTDRLMTIEEVAEMIGKSRAQAYRLLPRLIDEGVLVKAGRGRWRKAA